MCIVLVFSSSLQNLSEHFMLSVVLGSDIIPRLSIGNMEKLKVEILTTIKNSKLAKVSVCTGTTLPFNRIYQIALLVYQQTHPS